MLHQQPDLHRMAQVFKKAPPISLQLDAEVAFALVAQLQLALRHPQNTGPTADMVERAARTFQAHIFSWRLCRVSAERNAIDHILKRMTFGVRNGARCRPLLRMI